MLFTAEVDAREADNKDGDEILLRHVVTRGRKPCGYDWETAASCTSGMMCLASLWTAIRFCFNQWISQAEVWLNPFRQSNPTVVVKYGHSC